jgi:hypothetical protein
MNRQRRLAKMRDTEVTNAGRQEKLILMLGSDEQGFHVIPEEPPPEEFVALARAHGDRLRVLLDRPVILAVHWNEGDSDALVQIIPVKTDDSKRRFEEFTLAFPAVDGVAA